MKQIGKLICAGLCLASPAAAQSTACQGSEQVDACIVGTWEMISGGPIEWMQGVCGIIYDKTQGNLIGTGGPGQAVITYRDDGTYQSAPLGRRMDITDTGGGGSSGEFDPVRIEGQAQPATGRWSVTGDQLNTCQDTGGYSGQIFTTDIDRRPQMTAPGSGDIAMRYECDGATLVTIMSMGVTTGEFPMEICQALPGEVRRDAKTPGGDNPMVTEFRRVE
ncbi:hypothetical protein [uncultured Roseovarius sp.]|uniref:hypothetical protein n=1 Tax=uncultured Roseovarius sp. TaxID=293344 RepID=UPI002608B2B9|nr:hypothetical protein [uncultured Roseovarius sp.]